MRKLRFIQNIFKAPSHVDFQIRRLRASLIRLVRFLRHSAKVKFHIGGDTRRCRLPALNLDFCVHNRRSKSAFASPMPQFHEGDVDKLDCLYKLRILLVVDHDFAP